MSSTRPELSDFSKQFLSNNYSSNSSRPELSNITRAYLISQSPINENDNKDDEKEDNKNDNKDDNIENIKKDEITKNLF